MPHELDRRAVLAALAAAGARAMSAAAQSALKRGDRTDKRRLPGVFDYRQSFLTWRAASSGFAVSATDARHVDSPARRA